jgi:hypothetical protein
MEAIMKKWAVVVAVALMPSAAWSQDKAPQSASFDREEVIATVQKLFDAMAARDVEAARKVMVPEGRLFSTNEEFIDGLGRTQQKFLERMWNPEVRVHGAIATLWADYDSHLDGKFSHCGIDAFDLVRTADGWKIAGGVYSIERTGCAPSPLGEPK